MRPLIAERSPSRAALRGPQAGPAHAPKPAPARAPEPPQPELRRDPAPSIWSYRAQRLWLTPHFRGLVRVGLPCFVVALGLGLFFSNTENRAAFVAGWQEIKSGIENRPEFRISVLGIEGASDAVMAEIRAALALELPVSSFALDLEEMRSRIEALPAVARAELRIQSGGYLAVRVTERVPALVWQTREGPVLIDAEGHFVAALGARTLEAPLPMIGGDGADLVVAEALALHAAAAPLGDRLRGLVWVGERRWDVVLEDGRRILLPETGAPQALDRALALHDATDILGRDVLRIDLRDPDRLTVQLTPAAMEEFQRLRALDGETPTGEQSG